MKKRKSEIELMLIFLSPMLLYLIFTNKVRNLISSSLLNAAPTTEALNKIAYYFESSLNVMLIILYFYITVLFIIMRKKSVDRN